MKTNKKSLKRLHNQKKLVESKKEKTRIYVLYQFYSRFIG